MKSSYVTLILIVASAGCGPTIAQSNENGSGASLGVNDRRISEPQRQDRRSSDRTERQEAQLVTIRNATDSERAFFETCGCMIPETSGEYEERMTLLGQQTWARGLNLYVIIDTALGESWYNALRGQQEHWLGIQSLFAETPFENFDDLAPFVIRLAPNSPVLEWAFSTYETRERGLILLASMRGLDVVAEHLRSVRMANTGNRNEPVNFRYYDANILGAFLQASTREERIEFMSPIESIYIWQPFRTTPDVHTHPDSSSLFVQIGSAQSEAFSQVSLEHFYQLASAHLMRLYPNLEALEADATVRSAFALGRQFGITIEYDVSLLANIMVQTSKDLDTDPEYEWVMEILRDQARSARTRLEVILERLEDQ